MTASAQRSESATRTFTLSMNGVAALVDDEALGLHRLVRPDVVLGQRVVDDLRAPSRLRRGSDEAQYLPSRNSSTKTGTLAPTLTFRTRSLRTTLPAKCR